MNLEAVKARCDTTGGCWEWITQARTNARKRHPMTTVNGKPTLMRRHAFELVKGPIQPDRFLVPTCGNPGCIAPEHQQVITRRQKNKIGGRKSANSPTRGPKIAQTRRTNGTTKIDMEAAQAIRASDEAAGVLGLRYGIDPSRVTQIRRGHGWKDYSNPFAGLMG